MSGTEKPMEKRGRNSFYDITTPKNELRPLFFPRGLKGGAAARLPEAPADERAEYRIDRHLNHRATSRLYLEASAEYALRKEIEIVPPVSRVMAIAIDVPDVRDLVVP
jgi:hypothetical protein